MYVFCAHECMVYALVFCRGSVWELKHAGHVLYHWAVFLPLVLPRKVNIRRNLCWKGIFQSKDMQYLRAFV